MRHSVLVLLMVVAVSLAAPCLAHGESGKAEQLVEQLGFGPYFDPDG